jgi:hypothetical protein
MTLLRERVWLPLLMLFSGDTLVLKRLHDYVGPHTALTVFELPAEAVDDAARTQRRLDLLEENRLLKEERSVESCELCDAFIPVQARRPSFVKLAQVVLDNVTSFLPVPDLVNLSHTNRTYHNKKTVKIMRNTRSVLPLFDKRFGLEPGTIEEMMMETDTYLTGGAALQIYTGATSDTISVVSDLDFYASTVSHRLHHADTLLAQDYETSFREQEDMGEPHRLLHGFFGQPTTVEDEDPYSGFVVNRYWKKIGVEVHPLPAHTEEEDLLLDSSINDPPQGKTTDEEGDNPRRREDTDVYLGRSLARVDIITSGHGIGPNTDIVRQPCQGAISDKIRDFDFTVCQVALYITKKGGLTLELFDPHTAADVVNHNLRLSINHKRDIIARTCHLLNALATEDAENWIARSEMNNLVKRRSDRLEKYENKGFDGTGVRAWMMEFRDIVNNFHNDLSEANIVSGPMWTDRRSDGGATAHPTAGDEDTQAPFSSPHGVTTSQLDGRTEHRGTKRKDAGSSGEEN